MSVKIRPTAYDKHLLPRAEFISFCSRIRTAGTSFIINRGNRQAIIGFSVEFCVYSYTGYNFFNSEEPLLKSRMFKKIFCNVMGRRLAIEDEKEENA